MPTSNAKKIAVVLCGSGFRDGSEIHEAVAVLWALSSYPLDKIQVMCFAPDAEQFDVVNCYTGEVDPKGGRNMLVEAARIARGKVLPLSQLDTSRYHGIILPGGFGAAKNLCDFATKGIDAVVRPDLQVILEKMHQEGKPIGAICIAPMIVALAFKGKGFELTVGKNSATSKELEKLGHHHIECEADLCHFDKTHKLFTTPAYMEDQAPVHKVFSGISKLVSGVCHYTG